MSSHPLYQPEGPAAAAAAEPPAMILPQALQPGLSVAGMAAAAAAAAVASVNAGDKRPADALGGDPDPPIPPAAKRQAGVAPAAVDDARVKSLLKGIGNNLAAADKQYKELYSILLGEIPAVPKGTIGKVPHIAPTPPPDATVIDTDGFVARFKSLGGAARLEYWDSRQGTGTKLKYMDGKDLVIMGQFTKKATLCEILPAKEVESALAKRH